MSDQAGQRARFAGPGFPIVIGFHAKWLIRPVGLCVVSAIRYASDSPIVPPRSEAHSYPSLTPEFKI